MKPPKTREGKPKAPKWMECVWRRDICGKRTCQVCSEILKHREQHIRAGEDPDDFGVMLDDAGRDFKKALREIKAETKRLGIDIANIENIQKPPEPIEFPLYRRVQEWNHDLTHVIEDAYDDEEMWFFTEEGQDLLWYKNTLCAKIYRQLSNRWHLSHGDDYGDFDYDYTQYVLEECVKILNRSLAELIKLHTPQKAQFLIAASNLATLTPAILKI